MVRLDCGVMDTHKILAITDRYLSCSKEEEISSSSRIAVSLSLISCHANGTPLDLDGLLAANQEDLVRDVEGIVDNINIKTGELENGWLPQYTLKEEACDA